MRYEMMVRRNNLTFFCTFTYIRCSISEYDAHVWIDFWKLIWMKHLFTWKEASNLKLNPIFLFAHVKCFMIYHLYKYHGKHQQSFPWMVYEVHSTTVSDLGRYYRWLRPLGKNRILIQLYSPFILEIYFYKIII